MVDFVGRVATLTRAVQELSRSDKPQRVLIVPGDSVYAAKQIMHAVGVSGTVRDMEDAQRIYVSIPASNFTKPEK